LNARSDGCSPCWRREPVSTAARISLFRPVVREEAVEAVGEVLRSGWLGTGPRTRDFEDAFAGYVGAAHSVATNSCTSALQLALRVLDAPRGSEVVTTPLTFVGSNQVILEEGLHPVFADVDPTTGNLATASVAERLGDRTAAILPVHYGGYPCDLDELHALARARSTPVIEDCAHACGAVYRGRRVGSHGELHAFSFHAVKNLAIGDGGALTVRSEALAARLRRLRWFGISAGTFERGEGSPYRWDYGVDETGFKCAMNDVQAAIALAQLAHVDEDNARRLEIAARYRAGLEGIPGIELLRTEPDRISSHHLFCVLAEQRDGLVDRFSERAVDVGVHYRPSYDYPMFAAEPLPGVEAFWRRAISLPMHIALTDEQVDEVVEIVREGW
jgi:perosamine synthetase